MDDEHPLVPPCPGAGGEVCLWSSRTAMLTLCQVLFDALNSRGVRYCHWKSNCRLGRALEGKTDLDLLVHAGDRALFQEVVIALDFKEMRSPPESRVEGLEDYLGIDRETGKLVHLHNHYRLVVGERYLKNHHLPIEEMFFSNLVLSMGVPIPRPELEAVVLLIRAHLKADALALVENLLARIKHQEAGPFPSDIRSEFVRLLASVDWDELRGVLRLSGLPLSEDRVVATLRAISSGRVGFIATARMRQHVRKSLRGYRIRADRTVGFVQLWRATKRSRLVRPFVNQRRKTLAAGGIIVALVGPDGVGKSSLVADITAWLSWKLMVSRRYFGIPKRRSVRTWTRAIRLLKKIRLRRLSGCLEACLWLAVARARVNEYRHSREEAARGTVVIADRFPLAAFRACEPTIDGPRISPGTGRFGRFMARMELAAYDRIPLPDRVLLLVVAYRELRRRKPDADALDQERKASAVAAVAEDHIIRRVDAGGSYAEVLRQVKLQIW